MLLCCLWLTGCQVNAATTEPVVHLTFWHGVNPPANRDVLQTLVEQFNQTHPSIQVESLYVGQAEQQIPKILAAVVGNVPPHLLWYSPLLTGQLVELGALRPLDDWLTQQPVGDQIAPNLLESMALEGHYWSVPFGTNNVGIFYRPSLFAAAGVSALPQTWDELRQVALRLTERDRHGLLLPLGKGEWTVFMWLPFLWSAGGELIQEGAVNLASEGAIAALQFWRSLVEDGSTVLSAPERGFELDRFLAGKVAMQLTGPWILKQLNATGVDYGVMPIPVADKPATSTGGENIFVFKTTPREEAAALTFVAYLLSEEVQTEWAIETGYLPVNLQSRQSQPYQSFVHQNPAVQVFLDQAEYGRSRPISADYSRLSDQLGRAIEAVLLGKRSSAAALKAAQQRIELILGDR